MRWLVTFSISLAVVFGCNLQDALENAPCETNDDCLGDYTCVRTVHQEATALPGWCRNDGQCAAGEQEGCRASGGSCSNFLTVALDPATGQEFCCDSPGIEPTVTNLSVDLTSAQCVACDPNLCNDQAPATEECSEGQPRCMLIQDTCGCRVPEAQIEDSECEDASTCGEGFVCVRTLEQEAEPQEALPEEQAQELGWCRPEDTPECSEGRQAGCKATDGCPGGSLNYICTNGGRCYCCGDAPDSSFREHVYTETSMGESAACINCPNNCETGTSTCTTLEDPTCELTGSGPCGCTPSSM